MSRWKTSQELHELKGDYADDFIEQVKCFTQAFYAQKATLL